MHHSVDDRDRRRRSCRFSCSSNSTESHRPRESRHGPASPGRVLADPGPGHLGRGGAVGAFQSLEARQDLVVDCKVEGPPLDQPPAMA